MATPSATELAAAKEAAAAAESALAAEQAALATTKEAAATLETALDAAKIAVTTAHADLAMIRDLAARELSAFAASSAIERATANELAAELAAAKEAAATAEFALTRSKDEGLMRQTMLIWRLGQDLDRATGSSRRKRPPKFNDDLWEESRRDTGLQLIGDLAPAGATWDYKLRDEGRRSFVGFMASPSRKTG